MPKVTDVADEFLRLAHKSGRQVTGIVLVKLCIIANGWSLARNGRPLFDAPVEAWAHGPNIPELYAALKHWELLPVARDADAPPRVGGADAALIACVHKSYGGLRQEVLQDLTTRKDTPWELVRALKPLATPIPSALIRAHYLALEADRKKRAA